MLAKPCTRMQLARLQFCGSALDVNARLLPGHDHLHMGVVIHRNSRQRIGGSCFQKLPFKGIMPTYYTVSCHITDRVIYRQAC
jgi:hypothetical protein